LFENLGDSKWLLAAYHIQDCLGKSGNLQEEDCFLLSHLKLHLSNNVVICCIWSAALFGAEIWVLRKLGQKYLEIFRNVVLQKDGEDQLNRSCTNIKKYK